MDKELENEKMPLDTEILSEEEGKALSDVLKSFVENFALKEDASAVKEWLEAELGSRLPEYTQAEISEMSEEITTSLKITEEKRQAQEQAVRSGRSRESWFASDLLKSTSYMAAAESAKFYNVLDTAVRKANTAMHDTIFTKAGVVSQNLNLDGFIAEQHHVNSFNMSAAVKGGKVIAEVLKPQDGATFSKNSVDIVIKDATGKILRRYQAKYGADAKATIDMIKKGDYRGQRLLVPEEQLDEVRKAFPDRSVESTIGDGTISSKPLSKEEAKKLQEKAQNGNMLDLDWSDFSAKDIALGMGKQVGYSALLGAVIGGASFALSQRLAGEKIKAKELINKTLLSGADFGLKTALAGALKYASEKGILKLIPKGTKGSVFANIAFIAVEDAKIAWKVAKGELTLKEGADQMAANTISGVAGIAAAHVGTEIGAMIGSVIGPVGTAVGGFVGGAVGYMAGSKAGKMIYEGAKKVYRVAWEGAKAVAGKVKEGLTDIFIAAAVALS